MDVQISGSTLFVDIKTNYRSNDYDGFSNLDTDFGDFFIGIDGWLADTSKPHYLADNYTTGIWEYAFNVSSGCLYNITSAQDAINLSKNLMPSNGWIYRNGQEVSIDTSNLIAETSGGRANYDSDSGKYQLEIPLGNLAWDVNDLGFHRTMTCANDVIEGGAPVLELATMLLLGSGLIVLAVVGRKKLYKEG